MAQGRTGEQQERVDEQRQEQMITLLQQIAENTKSGIGGTGGPGAIGGGGSGTAISGGKSRRVGQSSGPDLSSLGGGPVGAIAAKIGAGVDKTIISPTKSVFAKSIGESFADDVRFGDDAPGFRSSFNRNAANLPFVGRQVSDVTDPLKRAGQRTNAITGMIARGGGVVSDEDRKALFERNLAEERRAQTESIAVEKLTKTELGSDSTNAAVDDSINKGFDRLINVILGIFS